MFPITWTVSTFHHMTTQTCTYTVSLRYFFSSVIIILDTEVCTIDYYRYQTDLTIHIAISYIV